MNRNAGYIFLGVGVLVLLGAAYFLLPSAPEPVPEEPIELPEVREPAPEPATKVIGSSVEGREITVTKLGSGDKHLLFVGGIHGGYEWNSVVLAEDMIDRFEADPALIPDSITVSIIPNLNPDGVVEALGVEGEITFEDGANDPGDGTGRFNKNGVDLNRNFDCKWQPESSWRGNTVSAGTEPFSEPEAQALRDYVTEIKPVAVIFWHSQANNVYASECEEGVLPETLDIMNVYATAASYGAVPVFDAYPVTGDAEGWLASIGIPAITVEMSTHTTLDWIRNVAGVEALFEYYATE